MKQDLKYLVYLAKQGKGNIHPHGEAATDCLIEALKIERGNKILEVGCGTGETMIRILSSYNVFVDGIDVLPEMLMKAKQRLRITGLKNKGKVFTARQNNSLPFENNYYDRVYAESVLGFQNEETVKKLLNEIHRILKKGGLFAVNDAIWKKDTSKEDIERINNSCIRDFGLSQASEQLWSIDNWNSVFKETGFEISSNDLISDLLEKKKRENTSKKKFKIHLSRILTGYYSVTGSLSFSMRRKSKNFKNLLLKHVDDGKYIESRLAVLKKNISD